MAPASISQKPRSLDRKRARYVCPPPKPSLRGPFFEGWRDAGEVGMGGNGWAGMGGWGGWAGGEG